MRHCCRSLQCKSKFKWAWIRIADNDRIARYTTAAAPTPASASTLSQLPYATLHPRPVSPTSSVKTNASGSTMHQDNPSQAYQQFPAQAARIPQSHSQVHIDSHQAGINQGRDGQQSQPAISRGHTRTNSASMTSPNLAGLTRETSWPVEAFGDLHLSGSEPRIFPGVVSRTQRRDSVRKSSMSETDDIASLGTSKKGAATGTWKGRSKESMDGAVEEEEDDRVENDSDMEEAGGMDE